MDSKNLSIICIFLIVIVAISAYFVAFHKTTEITIISGNNLANGDTFTIKLSSNGQGVVNKEVNVTLINSEGGCNVQQLTTNDNGEASFTLGGVADGEYSVECIFKGDLQYSYCQNDTTITVKTVSESISSSSSSGPYVIASYMTGDGGHMVYYSDGSYRFYDRNWVFHESGYERPEDFRC